MHIPKQNYHYDHLGKTYIWFGLFYFKFIKKENRVLLKINWKHWFIFLLVLLVSFWLLFSGALYFWFKYKRKFDDVKYSKMLIWPIRRSENRKELGKYWIGKGEELLNKDKIIDAFYYFKGGLNLYPNSIEARLRLSDFYFDYLNRPAWGIKILRDGLNYNPNIDYIKRTLDYMFKYEFYEDVLEIISNLLENERNKGFRNRLLIYKAEANYNVGNLFLSEKIIKDNTFYNFPEAMIIQSKIETTRGNVSEAIEILEKLIKKNPKYVSAYVLVIQLLKSRKYYEKAHLYSILLQSMNSQRYEPRLNNLQYYYNLNNEPLLLKELKNYLEDFRYDNNAIINLSNFVEKTNSIHIAKTLYQHNYGLKHQKNHFFFAYIFTLLSKQKGHEVLVQLQDEKLAHITWNPVQINLLNGIKSLAYTITKQPNLVEFYFNRMINDSNINLSLFLKMGIFYNILGDFKMASKSFEEAYKRYPNSPKALLNLLNYQIEKEENIDKIIKNIVALHDKNYFPNKSLLNKAFDYINTDKFIYSAGYERAINLINMSLFELDRVYIQN